MSDSYLVVKTQTWRRENQILFDFDTKNLSKSTFKVKTDCIFSRNQDDIYTASTQTDQTHSQSLFSIKKSKDKYQIEALDSSPYSQMWKVIRYLPSGSYLIKQNDILKLGREVLKVKMISGAIQQERQISLIPENDDEKICKICCCEEISPDDPLIHVCKCSGSLRYTHYTCLKNWLKGKVTRESLGSVSTYVWKELKCEICNVNLPELFEFKGKLLSLLEIEYPDTPYLVLEEVKDEEDRQTMFVVSLNEGQSVVVGRGGESEIRLNDISVSRAHARIKFSGNKFFLVDNKSKFGTLALADDLALDLASGKEVVVQVNKTVVSFKVARPFRCCWKRSVLPV